jgi:hypothetical protein
LLTSPWWVAPNSRRGVSQPAASVCVTTQMSPPGAWCRSQHNSVSVYIESWCTPPATRQRLVYLNSITKSELLSLVLRAPHVPTPGAPPPAVAGPLPGTRRRCSASRRATVCPRRPRAARGSSAGPATRLRRAPPPAAGSLWDVSTLCAVVPPPGRYGVVGTGVLWGVSTLCVVVPPAGRYGSWARPVCCGVSVHCVL